MALDSGKSQTGYGALTGQLIEQFAAARRLVLQLDNETYARVDGGGSIGKHIRHNLNFLEAALAGIGSGRIDYSARSRDNRIETNGPAAIEKIDAAIAELNEVSEELNVEVAVVSEADPAILHSSTISRELEFVLSHTIHHHAIIHRLLRDSQCEALPDFGVAPSTLEYWKRQQG